MTDTTMGSHFGSRSNGILIAQEPDQLDIKPATKSHIDERSEISEPKSPFKTMVKQKPIEADASVVPMETETNVKDDDADSTQKQTNNFQLLQHQEANKKKRVSNVLTKTF